MIYLYKSSLNNKQTLSSFYSFFSFFPFIEYRLPDLERKACQVLCRLRNEGDDAKEVNSSTIAKI